MERFVVHDSCKLTYGEFYHYMELACCRYAERHPERAQELEASLKKYAERFL